MCGQKLFTRMNKILQQKYDKKFVSTNFGTEVTEKNHVK